MSAARSNSLRPIQCEADGCPSIFKPYHRAQRFCGERCANRERARERRAAKGEGVNRRRPNFTTSALETVMSQLRTFGKVGLV